jgi:NADPH-dependent curcumin reductase CurA
MEAVNHEFQGGAISKYRTSRRGLESFPDTLLRLFAGENAGKLVLEVAGP